MNEVNYKIMENPIVKDIIGKFVRKCPKNLSYLNRLVTELDIIIKKKFYEYIFQVVELLDLVKDINRLAKLTKNRKIVRITDGSLKKFLMDSIELLSL